MKKKRISILLFLLGHFILISACFNGNNKKDIEKNNTEATLIAQTGNMVILKMQILMYEGKYGHEPKSIKVLKLPKVFKDSIRINNIKYPDDRFLFYEKEPQFYGLQKGRFFVYKDGFIEFVPVDKTPSRIQ